MTTHFVAQSTFLVARNFVPADFLQGCLFHFSICFPYTPNSSSQGTRMKFDLLSEAPLRSPHVWMGFFSPPVWDFFPLFPFVMILKCYARRVWVALRFCFRGLWCVLDWVQLRLGLQEANNKAQTGKRWVNSYSEGRACGKGEREIPFVLYENAHFSEALFKGSPAPPWKEWLSH